MGFLIFDTFATLRHSVSCFESCFERDACVLNNDAWLSMVTQRYE